MNFEKCRPFEIYEYYDGPLIYAIKNENKNFLAYVWDWFDEPTKTYSYLYFEMDDQIFTDLKADKISIRNFMETLCNNGKATKVTYGFGGVQQKAEIVDFVSISNDAPLDGVFLESNPDDWKDYIC